MNGVAAPPHRLDAAWRSARPTALLVAGAAALLGLFTFVGPSNALGGALVGALVLCLLIPFRRIVLGFAPAILAPALYLPQVAPAIWAFDPVALGAIALGVLALLRSGRRSAWDLGPAQLFVVAGLIVPLLALPTTVVSLSSFTAGYKLIIVESGFFLALGYLVGRERIHRLLWAFPLSGALVSLEIAWKMRGAGLARLARLDMRNFNSDLRWGASNFIAAVLTLCILGTVLVLVRERRVSVRILLLAGIAVMLGQSIRMYSRGAELALAAAVVVLGLGLGGMRALLVLGLAGAGGAAVLATPYGKVFLERFSDPVEFASWGARVQIWVAMWSRFLAHPLTGIGLNQGRYQTDVAGAEGAHNFVLEYLNEQGILGGILIVSVFVTLFVLAARLGRPGDTRGREVRAAALALLTGVTVNSLIEPTLSGFPYTMLFVYFIVWLRFSVPAAAPTLAAPTPAHA